MGFFSWLSRVWKHIELSNGDFADFSEVEDIYNSVMATICVICAGLAAGLTVGLLSLDVTKLEIKIMTGSPEERLAAEKVLPIVKQHHLLLVTLLLFNSVANETLPIFLGSLMPNYLAVLCSVSLVLVFGEILPSALFTGPKQLITAAHLTKLVYFLIFIFYPVSYPLGLLLDYLFGVDESSGSISRDELEALVILQGQSKEIVQSSESFISEMASVDFEEEGEENERLTGHEVNLMTGILKLSKVMVKDAMIPMNKVFRISSSTRLDEKSLYDILDSGFSRIPVYRRHDKQYIIGYLLVKELIVVNPLDNKMVDDLNMREPLFVKPNLHLMNMLTVFKNNLCHMAIVTNDPLQAIRCLREKRRPTGDAIAIGIVTLEDVLEKILQSEIVDETDRFHSSPTSTVLYPSGGIPTMFYNRGASNKQNQKRPKSKRQRVFHKGSVVSSDEYNGFRYGPPERESSIHVLKTIESIDEEDLESDSRYYQYSTKGEESIQLLSRALI